MSSETGLLNSLYKIEKELGSGGGGVVYKAWHSHLQKYVVIKELKRGTNDSLETQRNEVEALKNVKSAYLPQVLDFFTENGRVFTVMEFVNGISFDKLLERNHRFTQSQVVKWYGQLASALEVIHKQNIAHRDIKPANIMLLPNDDICLIDFNAALVMGSDVRLISRSLGYASPEQYEIYEKYKHTRNAPIQYTLSRTSNYSQANASEPQTELLENNDATELVGTQSYSDKTELISPRPSENVDWKLSDIYSLGATMYHLLTGIRPHERAEQVQKLSTLGEYDEGLTYIVESSMNYAPANRIPSAEALMDAIRNIYRYDSRWQALQIKQIAAAIILPLAFSGFFLMSVFGINQIRQDKEEQYYSLIYEIQNGNSPDEDYSNALEMFDRADAYYARAKRYWANGEFAACKEFIEENLGKIAKFKADKSAKEAIGNIYYLLGDCYYFQSGSNDYLNAKENYSLALEYSPANPTLRRDYAVTLARLGSLEEAREELEKAKVLQLDAASISLLNGEISYSEGDLSTAQSYFSFVVSQTDDDYIRYRAFHSLDEIYKQAGQYQDSIDMLSEALQKIPVNYVSEMKERLADSYYRNGDIQNSIQIFEELIQTSPSYNAQQNLVIMYQKENEFRKAAMLLESMKQQYPNDYRVPMRQAFLETDIQSHIENSDRNYQKVVEYYNEASKLYAENFRPGETDAEMQKLEALIQQLRDTRWIE